MEQTSSPGRSTVKLSLNRQRVAQEKCHVKEEVEGSQFEASEEQKYKSFRLRDFSTADDDESTAPDAQAMRAYYYQSLLPNFNESPSSLSDSRNTDKLKPAWTTGLKDEDVNDGSSQEHLMDVDHFKQGELYRRLMSSVSHAASSPEEEKYMMKSNTGGKNFSYNCNTLPSELTYQSTSEKYISPPEASTSALPVPHGSPGGSTVKKILTCPMCSKIFHYNSQYDVHVLTHTGEKPHRCSECGKGFSQHGNLKRHMVRHTGMRPHPCELCDKSFGSRSEYRLHMMVHNGDKPYSCPDCDKCFVQSCHLTQHVRIHTGDKSFVCPYCDRRFAQSATLTGHIRTHTNTKYTCQYCGKVLNSIRTFNRHLFTHPEHQNGNTKMT